MPAELRELISGPVSRDSSDSAAASSAELLRPEIISTAVLNLPLLNHPNLHKWKDSNPRLPGWSRTFLAADTTLTFAGEEGFEPTTYGLTVRSSTTELLPQETLPKKCRSRDTISGDVLRAR